MNIGYREMRPDDAALVVRHRESMFREAGSNPSRVAASLPAFERWVRRRLIDGRYVGFVAESEDGAVAASIGLMVIDWPPHPKHPLAAGRGYVLNLYVEPRYRRMGLGADLMARAEQEARDRGLHFAMLHTTALGRPVYERRGWYAIDNEMGLELFSEPG
jgi:GNAT superfamily N-acetyltransferase